MPTVEPRTTAATLVAIAVAAHKTGDRSLLRSALHLLRQEHGIRIAFARKPPANSHQSEAAR